MQEKNDNKLLHNEFKLPISVSYPKYTSILEKLIKNCKIVRLKRLIVTTVQQHVTNTTSIKQDTAWLKHKTEPFK